MRCAACTRFNLLAIACITTALALLAAQYVRAVPTQAPSQSPATSPTIATTAPAPAKASTPATTSAVPVLPAPTSTPPPATSTASTSGATAARPTTVSTIVAIPKKSGAAPVKPSPCKPTKTVVSDDTKLRSGWKGVDYRNNLVEPSGTPPFTFTLSDCALPSGVELKPDGRLQGKADETGTFHFAVTVKDSAMPPKSVMHYYELRMYLPTTAVDTRKPPAQQTVTGIPLSEAERQTREQNPRMNVYKLTDKKIAELMKPPAPVKEAKDAKDASDNAAADDSKGTTDTKDTKDAPAETTQDADKAADAVLSKQLQGILLELNNVEYPSRDLFERALDAALCSYVNKLATGALNTANVTTSSKPTNPANVANAKAQKLVLPPIVCPALPLEKRPALEPTKKGDTDTISPAELPQRILPDDMRKRIIERAREEYFFGGLPPLKRSLWSGGDCGCLNEGLNRQVYGFYPFWRATGGALGAEEMPPPQLINFSLMSRIAYVALPIDDTGSFNNTMQLNDRLYPTDFIRVAKRHRTQLDVVLYRNTWQSLLKDDAKMNRLIAQLPENALNLIDTRLADQASRVQSWLSFIEPAPRLGDGLTLYFDDFDDVDSGKFADFFDKLMNALIENMQARSRNYALNVVIPDRLLNRAPAFTFEKLLKYLVKAEKLKVVKERIVTNVESTTSNSNIDISYLILLSEPTRDSKKKLRQSAELPDAVGLKGSNRKFFLRNVIPVISYAGANEPNAEDKQRQFADDLIYLSDNFNGVGLWNMPYNNPAPDPGNGIYEALSNNLLASNAAELFTNTKLCSFICINRWWGRLVLITLLLIGVVSLPVRMLVCNRFVQSPRYLYFLWLGGIGTALVAIIMLECDPDQKQWIAPLFSPKFLLGIAAAGIALVVLLEKRKRYIKP